MRTPPALGAYLLASRLAGAVARPILGLRRGRGKEDPERLDERLGHAGRARPEGRLVWLHAASVGEAMSALPLIGAMLARAEGSVLLTTGTVTAARRVGPMLPGRAIHQFAPVDTAGAVGRFLDHWRPDLAIWIESELWPRMVVETSRRGIPMAMVNARISARSFERWKRGAGMARALLSRFGLILTQDHETVDRIASLGGKAVFGGNLKAAAPPEAEAEVPAAAQGRPVWLAASTHAGEEKVVIEAHGRVLEEIAEALLILAPRHPERGGEVAAMLDAAGMAFARRSAGEGPGPDRAVWLADTLGEMAGWYRAAAVTFVGGSLVDRGGHTPFEPIAAGSALLTGPHVANFAPAYAQLTDEGGVQTVDDADSLARAFVGLLLDEEKREAMTARAGAVHRALVPDVDALADRLLALEAKA